MKNVEHVWSAPRGHWVGDGFPVRTLFNYNEHAPLLSPFLMLDYVGPVTFEPTEQRRGVGEHPHRGFETVTYIMDGRFQHQDSHGGGGMITDGATQWMTAGQGVLHIETPPRELVDSGGLFHGIQLWVNLPAKDKMIAPRYQNLEGGQVTLLASSDAGALVRVIAGELDGHRGPGSTFTPITMAHATVNPGERLSLPWRKDFNSLVYVLAGRGTVGGDARPVHTGQLAVMGAGDRLTIAADEHQSSKEPKLEVLLLGGQPIGDPVVQYGPFVMNSRQEIVQAFEDFQHGRLGQVPADGLRPYHGRQG